MNICVEYGEKATSCDGEQHSKPDKRPLEKLLAGNVVDRHNKHYASEKGSNGDCKYAFSRRTW
jgi:hypothetical protein